MSAQHTPGPWKFTSGAVYSGTGSRLLLADRENPRTSGAERDDNLRLAAAAPEMFALLCCARDELADLNQNENDGGKLLADIDAALCKATGGDDGKGYLS